MSKPIPTSTGKTVANNGFWQLLDRRCEVKSRNIAIM